MDRPSRNLCKSSDLGGHHMMPALLLTPHSTGVRFLYLISTTYRERQVHSREAARVEYESCLHGLTVETNPFHRVRWPRCTRERYSRSRKPQSLRSRYPLCAPNFVPNIIVPWAPPTSSVAQPSHFLSQIFQSALLVLYNLTTSKPHGSHKH